MRHEHQQREAKLLKVQTPLFVLCMVRAVCVSLNSITSILSVSIVSKIKRKHDQTGGELL